MMEKKTITGERRCRFMAKRTYDQPYLEFFVLPEESVLCSSVDNPLLDDNETPFLIYT